MALQFSLSPLPSFRSAHQPVRFSLDQSNCQVPTGSVRIGRRSSFSKGSDDDSGRGAGRSVAVRTSLDTAGPLVGQVTEVNKETFWPLVKAAGSKVVVLDMYTQWCGPCKVMAPKFQELSENYLDVVFMKLDCNQDNKSLAKELGIKVVPTFKILKDSKVVNEVTGAKFEELVSAIDTVKSSS